MPITTVVFDVGETLVDETRHWTDWADWMGVPAFTFFAAMGVIVERRRPHREVFDLVRPGYDLAAAQASRKAAGWAYSLERGDFYPDAFPCLADLRNNGYHVGISGNQPEAAEASLRDVGIAADFIASSTSWGVEKPSPAFFDRVVEVAGCPAGEIAYVGDRLDNDVLPAKAAGMTAVFIRRGPWGIVHAGWPDVARADARLESLSELRAALEAVG
ncbi:MAG TPA: HAD family hydrolase [Caulobacteraceae bacterium]